MIRSGRRAGPSGTVASVRARIACVVAAAAVLVLGAACASEPDSAERVVLDGTTVDQAQATVPGTAPTGTDVPGTTPTTTPDPDPTQAPTSLVPTSTSPGPPGGLDPDPASTGTGPRCAEQDGYVAVGGGRRALLRGGAAAGPRAAVVVLHGFTGTPESIERTSGWTPFAVGRGAIVAYAEGTPVAAGGYGWNTGTVRFSTSGVDDAAYLAALVDHLVATACVDPARILLTGESNGGAMTVAAACAPATRDRFAVFAPVIPAVDQGVLDRCGSGPPIDLVALAGRLDPVIPYDGVYPTGQAPLLAQEAWFTGLAAQRNGCGAGPPTRVRLDGAEDIHAAGCPSAPTLVAIDDAGHTWPGGPVGTGSQPPGRFDATAFLWGRFVAAVTG